MCVFMLLYYAVLKRDIVLIGYLYKMFNGSLYKIHRATLFKL